MRLGAAYLGNIPLVEAGRPILAAARDATGESVSRAVREDTQVLFAARAEARRRGDGAAMAVMDQSRDPAPPFPGHSGLDSGPRR
jgi:DNA-binding IclR family transcriptional regulator